MERGDCLIWGLSGADLGISKRVGGAVEFLDLRFALMPLHTYPIFLLVE